MSDTMILACSPLAPLRAGSHPGSQAKGRLAAGQWKCLNDWQHRAAGALRVSDSHCHRVLERA
eukprot:10602863-Alexandrium_andersonii.AAC.1